MSSGIFRGVMTKTSWTNPLSVAAEQKVLWLLVVFHPFAPRRLFLRYSNDKLRRGTIIAVPNRTKKNSTR